MLLCPESNILGNSSSDEEIAREKISWAKAADAYSTPEVCQKLAMLLSTGSNAAAYFAFHFSAETKRMHQAIRHSPDVPASL